MGQVTEGQWTYIVENGGATITGSIATGAVTIPSVLGGVAVKKVGNGSTPIFGTGNTSVTSVVIPNSVTSILNNAFQECTNLASITIGNGVTSIGSSAFRACSQLTSATIGNSVTSIGSSAFNLCTSLTSITIPDGVTSIGDNAFNNCTSLISITIPNSVTSIGDSVFNNCRALIIITIPNSVTSIGNNVFQGCTKLVTVYLPARFANTYINFGLTASQANFGITLTASYNSSEGTLLANPNKLPYEAGESVVVTATPNAGYLFSNWSGDSTATTSSITLTMDASKTVNANFVQDGGDNDGDGLTNYQESVTYGTNPNIAETASPVAGLYLANQMQAMAIGDLVLTKNTNGSFTLNYDIEKSDNLQTWTTYQALSLPLTGLPTDKAFVRIKAKQEGVSSSSSSQATPTTDLSNPSSGGGNGSSSGQQGPGGVFDPNL
jgi:hypothetical protein